MFRSGNPPVPQPDSSEPRRHGVQGLRLWIFVLIVLAIGFMTPFILAAIVLLRG
jgi:hypothetical protein